MKYLIQYTLPYQHRVVIGLHAEDHAAALVQAQALFEAGNYWQDTHDVPLLADAYEQVDHGPLQFTVEQTLDTNAPWPEPHGSVRYARRREAAFAVAQLFIDVYRRGEKRGSVLWSELDDLYALALQAA